MIVLRYAAGLIAAAVTATCLFFLLEFAWHSGTAIIVLAFALAHAVILGLPVWLLLKTYNLDSFLAAAIAGFFIGAIPIGLVGLALVTGQYATGDFEWLEFLNGLVYFGIIGMSGGLSAWAVWTFSAPRPLRVTLPVFAAAGLILAMPILEKDRSCHNPLRGGQATIAPELRGRLYIPPDDWPVLADIFRDFSQERGWRFRMSIETDHGRYLLSVCKGEGTLIRALKNPFAPVHSSTHWIFFLTVFQPQGGESWQDPTRSMIALLERKWPGGVEFTDEKGRTVPAPDWLVPETDQPDADAP